MPPCPGALRNRNGQGSQFPYLEGSLLGLGAPLSWCPSESQRLRCTVETRGVFKHNILDSSFSSTLFCFCFLLTISRVWLLGRIYYEYIMVVWMHLFLFCVTPNAYWCILIRFDFWAYLCSKLSIFHSFCVCRLGEQPA